MEISYTEIDRENTAFGELLLRRFRSGDETGYEILLDGSFLMASHGCHSERAMADLARLRLPRQQEDLSVLVGGLGAGHTLRAVLDLEGVDRVVVAEIGACVVEWNRRFFAEFNDRAVDDPRVEIKIADVVEVLASSQKEWDLVLLDVDNGPGWLAAPANARLYSREGLRHCRRALRPDGVLAVWSPARNRELGARLQQIFAEVDKEDTTPIGRQHGEPGSVIYLAR